MTGQYETEWKSMAINVLKRKVHYNAARKIWWTGTAQLEIAAGYAVNKPIWSYELARWTPRIPGRYRNELRPDLTSHWLIDKRMGENGKAYGGPAMMIAMCVESIAFGYNMAGQGAVHEHSFQTQLQKAVHGCMNGTCSQWKDFSGSGVQRLIGTRDINKELKLFYETQMVTSIQSIREDKDK